MQAQPKQVEHKEDAVLFYRKDAPYGEFSNFFPSPITLDGKNYPTVQHYFQAQKFAGTEHQLAILKVAKPVQAFRLGQSRQYPIRKDWEQVKDQVMYKGLAQKFTKHEALKEKLLGTKDRKIVEHTERDRYWADGGGNGKGKNRLGELLMRVRKEIVEGKLK